MPTLVESILSFNFKKVSCGSNHSALLDDDGNVYAFGCNENGQVGESKKLPSYKMPIQVFGGSGETNSQDNN